MLWISKELIKFLSCSLWLFGSTHQEQSSLLIHLWSPGQGAWWDTALLLSFSWRDRPTVSPVPLPKYSTHLLLHPGPSSSPPHSPDSSIITSMSSHSWIWGYILGFTHSSMKVAQCVYVHKWRCLCGWGSSSQQMELECGWDGSTPLADIRDLIRGSACLQASPPCQQIHTCSLTAGT